MNTLFSRKLPNARPFRGILIPSEFFDAVDMSKERIACGHSKINASQFLLLSVIKSYTQAKGKGCFLSIKNLGEKSGGLSLRGTQVNLKILREKGFIYYQRIDGKRAIFTRE